MSIHPGPFEGDFLVAADWDLDEEAGSIPSPNSSDNDSSEVTELFEKLVLLESEKRVWLHKEKLYKNLALRVVPPEAANVAFMEIETAAKIKEMKLLRGEKSESGNLSPTFQKGALGKDYVDVVVRKRIDALQHEATSLTEQLQARKDEEKQAEANSGPACRLS